MKPILKDGWVHCLGLFMPSSLDEDDWEKMSIEERDQKGDWTPYRFDPKQLRAYNKSEFTACCVIRFIGDAAMTIQATIEDMDEIMAKAV